MYSCYRHSCGVTGALTFVFASLPQRVPTESAYSHWPAAPGVAEKLLHLAAEVSNGGQVVEGVRLKRVGRSFEKMLTIRVKFSRVWPLDKELCGNSPCFKKSCTSIESSDWWLVSTSGALTFNSGHAFYLAKENKSHALIYLFSSNTQRFESCKCRSSRRKYFLPHKAKFPCEMQEFSRVQGGKRIL